MATALYLVLSIGLLVTLYAANASAERERRRQIRELLARRRPRLPRRAWPFDPKALGDESPGATIRSAANSRGWR